MTLRSFDPRFFLVNHTLDDGARGAEHVHGGADTDDVLEQGVNHGAQEAELDHLSNAARGSSRPVVDGYP
ncbi:MAG: hypothetical protein MZV70_54420 [Desulfobacterales bacterium]|nr:hypothetical protein [Desulfobacterales bacterium]